MSTLLMAPGEDRVEEFQWIFSFLNGCGCIIAPILKVGVGPMISFFDEKVPQKFGFAL